MAGFADEVWWSRLAQPRLHAWSEAAPLRLQELTLKKAEEEPKALCCYGLLRTDTAKVSLRFVEGRPVSSVTCEFLLWICAQLAAEGKRALLLVWDNASWHISRAVSRWLKEHNREAKRQGGVRVLVCRLPVKSPWLNPIEARWVHGKRAVVEPTRALTGQELEARVCGYYGCEKLSHLKQQLS